MMTILPHFEPERLQQCDALTQIIRQEIELAGGYMSFARFMELALYAPEYGYYNAETLKFGAEGDFVTAPGISPLFALCLAKQFAQVLAAVEGGDILEIGAGTGVLAKDVLLALEKAEQLPEHYFILERSLALRKQQKTLLQATVPHLFSRMVWLDELPKAGIKGIIFANEMLDAMPVHCFQITEESVLERCVVWESDQFQWRLQSPRQPILQERLTELKQYYALPNGYQSEINLALPSWISQIAQSLNQGLILLVDYGYGQREYYHPARMQGTLMSFCQHQKGHDPLAWPGLQDMTAHVDFTRVVESAMDARLNLVGYTTQAAFLFACGLMDMAHAGNLTEVERYQQNQAIKRLTLPAEMGEIVKVMGLGKSLPGRLLGFNLYDRRHDL